jgi:cytochrome c oxidase subunit 2
MHNVLEPLGPFAAAAYRLYRAYFATNTVVYVLVIIALVGAIVRSSARAAAEGTAPVVEPDHGLELRLSKIVGTCVGVTVLVLFALLIADFTAGRKMAALVRPNPLAITLTGHQWWWEARYDDSLPSRAFITANELHIPTGRPVRLDLRSFDVIHSFWVPSLGGKKDLIPGHENVVWIQADQPGVFGGQCAEFCGLQHAHMRLEIIAETPDSFDAWRSHQLATPAEPANDQLRHGRDVFLAGTCIMCHSVAGTPARAGAGPDLSHVGGRRMIASGSLTNTTEHLAQWISDPGKTKPGVLMPPNPMRSEDLDALAAWLASLK